MGHGEESTRRPRGEDPHRAGSCSNHMKIARLIPSCHIILGFVTLIDLILTNQVIIFEDWKVRFWLSCFFVFLTASGYAVFGPFLRSDTNFGKSTCSQRKASGYPYEQSSPDHV
jgi:hypothetical protein